MTQEPGRIVRYSPGQQDRTSSRTRGAFITIELTRASTLLSSGIRSWAHGGHSSGQNRENGGCSQALCSGMVVDLSESSTLSSNPGLSRGFLFPFRVPACSIPTTRVSPSRSPPLPAPALSESLPHNLSPSASRAFISAGHQLPALAVFVISCRVTNHPRT